MRYLVNIAMGFLLALAISAPIGAAPFTFLRDMAIDRAEARAANTITCKRWGWRWNGEHTKCVRALPFPFI